MTVPKANGKCADVPGSAWVPLLEGFCFIKRKLDEGNFVNLGVLYHPGHDALYCILNTTTLNENKLVYPTCSATS